MVRRVERIRLAAPRQPGIYEIVDGLRNPDQPPERLLEVLRRPREISLEELPPAPALSADEPLQAESIV